MYKLLADSDALIKASKADFLSAVAKNFDVFITDDVYDETVKEGKKELYKDAEKIENLIEHNQIKVLKRENYKKKKKPKQNLGKGEISVFQAYTKRMLIVTDDLNFTSYLQSEHIQTISSAYLLVRLVKGEKLNKDTAYYYLEKLRPFIRKEVYGLVKKDIEGEWK